MLKGTVRLFFKNSFNNSAKTKPFFSKKSKFGWSITLFGFPSLNIFEYIYVPIYFLGRYLKLGKSAFKNTNTYKDRNIETEQVWLTSLDTGWEKFEVSQLLSRLVKPNLLSSYILVFVCIDIFKVSFSHL